MTGRFFTSIVNYFINHKFQFWSLLAIVVSVLLLGISRLKVDADIYSIFPKGKEFKEFSEVIQDNKLNNQLVFSFDAASDEDENFDLLENISVELQKTFEKEIDNIQIYKDIDQLELMSYLQSVSIAFLNEKDYQKILPKLEKDSILKQLENVKKQLVGVNSIFVGKYFSKDPLNVLGEKMQDFNLQSDTEKYQVVNGIVYNNDQSKVFFFADLQIDFKDNEKLEGFDNRLKKFIQRFDSKLHFDYFGVYQIALENAKQIKKDTIITSLISLSLIVLLLLLYYRNVWFPFYFLLPAFFGVLTGLGITGFVHPEINGISIATASVLLGIVLDYSFHFYTHYKHSGDLIATIKEIGSPMIIGSFTTVAAFAALLFTQSVVLKHFGLIALFTLLGSALFTLLVLPVILHFSRLKLKNHEKNVKNSSLPNWVVRMAMLTIVAFTSFCLFNFQGLNFDGDLNNLSYHTEDLKDKEMSFTGIEAGRQRRLYLFSNGNTVETSKIVAQELFKRLAANKENLQLAEILSPAPFLIAENEWEIKNKQWIDFWKQHIEVKNNVLQKADNLGFSQNAFSPFFNLIENQLDIKGEGEELMQQLGMSRLVQQHNGNHSILTSVVIPNTKVEDLKKIVNEIDDVYLMDVSELVASMLLTVKNDFDFLLYFSSAIVFISLLIVYGRIELAIFSFFPMLLAWVWILGITSIFDIQFNFVNIIIATFIFGLGDDFSIFITDGLIQKYKTNKENLASYKSAIVLSGITTIIGTGALFFAKHPSIHSIALVSVIGISSIMLVTLYIQPKVFNWFVFNRTTKKRGPITFLVFIYSLFLFFYFFLGSILLSVFLLIFIIPLPVKKEKKQRILNYIISKLAKSTIYLGFHVRKKYVDIEKLDYSQPSIIVANHTSFLDILSVLMLNPKTIIMVKSWVYNSPIFGVFIRYAGYIFVGKGTETNLKLIKQQLDNGYSLVIFPEGTRSNDGEIHRFHKGAFALSRELNIPIQPLLLIGLHEINPKNDIMINPGEYYIKAMDKVYPNASETDKEYTKRVQQLMRNAYELGRKEHAQTSFWQHSILQNYIYKGPVLEWYVRIKFMLERKNFEKYDEIIGERNQIYDIGCGYGYLSYYLHYRNPKRKIVGVDYDEEKTLTAQNALKKNENLQFLYADVKKIDFQQSDVVFLNDVLHYIPKKYQFEVLEKIVNSLLPNGVIFIRDGVTDLDNRIKNTERTEKLSTKIFNFNKTENDLEFLKVKEIQQFAENYNLSFEMIEHSKTTSNVLFILKK